MDSMRPCGTVWAVSTAAAAPLQMKTRRFMMDPRKKPIPSSPSSSRTDERPAAVVRSLWSAFGGFAWALPDSRIWMMDEWPSIRNTYFHNAPLLTPSDQEIRIRRQDCCEALVVELGTEFGQTRLGARLASPAFPLKSPKLSFQPVFSAVARAREKKHAIPQKFIRSPKRNCR